MAAPGEDDCTFNAAARGTVEARAGAGFVTPPPGVAAACVAAASVGAELGAELGPSAWDDGETTSPDGCMFIARLATSMLGCFSPRWLGYDDFSHVLLVSAADASRGGFSRGLR